MIWLPVLALLATAALMVTAALIPTNTPKEN